jgi:type II secretory pathway pseudopilin PulG
MAVVVVIAIIGILANLFLPEPPARKDEAAEARAAAETKEAAEAKAAAGVKEAPKKLIADAVVEMVFRKQIQKFTGEPTKVELEKITQLRIWYNQPSDLSDLKELTQLTMLDISW